MASANFSGPVVSANGFTATAGGITVTAGPITVPANAVTADTTITAATYAGRTIIVNSASGAVMTLPAATGTGNVYTFIVGTTVTSNAFKVQVASSSDYMRGFALGVTDTAGTAMAWNTANTGTGSTESDTISMNGTTQGGRIGDTVVVTDIATNVFAVRVFNVGSGTEATPFSAAV